MLGVDIGTAKKVGDEVRGGIGIGDGDVADESSVSMRADLCSKPGCIWGNCTSGVEESWLRAAVGNDGGVVGDDVCVLLGPRVDNTIVVDLGIGVGCGGKDIGRCVVRLVGLG